MDHGFGRWRPVAQRQRGMQRRRCNLGSRGIGQPLLRIHSADTATAETAAAALRTALTLGDRAPAAEPVIHAVLTAAPGAIA